MILAGYIYENTRLLLLSTSKAYPNGLSNNHGQVGQNYMGHGLASASVSACSKVRSSTCTVGRSASTPRSITGDVNNFDHSGLGFIAGGMVSGGMESKPISTAGTVPPGVPMWGSAYKAWLAAER